MGIPLTVIGGYLGAGKTTLLNHLLGQSRGRRFAVLVNDFGSLNIDAALIDGDVLTLENGCICCSMSSGLANALHTVSQMDPLPEHVLVESSGVSDPARVAAFAYTAPFSPDGIVVVADAETVRERSTDKYVGDSVLRQLKCADLIVLNKTDLVTPDQLADLRAWLGGRVLEASFGRVPLAELLGVSTGAAPEVVEVAHGYRSWSWQSDAPLPESQLRACVEAWPDTVLRAKGILNLAERPAKRTIFQRMGQRWTLTPGRPWGEEKPCSQLVLIGLEGQVDGERLLAGLTTDGAATAPV